MHELALVTAILSAVEEVHQKERGKIRKIRVHLGELQGLDREVIREHLEAGLKEMGIGAGYELVEEEASFRCRRCGRLWNLRELELSSEVREYIHFLPEAVYAYVRCPSCGTHDYEIAGGRGARVSLVLEG